MYKLPNGKIVYPEDVQCVHEPVNGKGGIWIGNLQAAENIQTLKKNGIKAILTAAKGVLLNHSKTQIPFQLYIPGEDHQRFDISKYFHQSISFIRDALQKTNILVHCLAGVSRSVSLVMAYFIKYHNMSYDVVYTKIKSRRKIIHPNDGFITQLKKFEAICRQNGPVPQREDLHQMRSSYSPSKRYDRKGFQGYQPSPQKFSQSPEKRVVRNTDRFKYSQYESNQKFNGIKAEKNVKNPQLYKSIVEDIRKQRLTKQASYSHMRHFSPDKYQKQNRLQSSPQNRVGSSFGLKRLSSMNVNLQNPIDLKRSQIYDKYQRFEPRSRVSSDYKPLDSIQNKQYDMNCQIDRKIAQIRRKYQQYTKQPEGVQQRQDRSRLDRKYSNISTVQQTNQNSNIDDLVDLKMKKMTSNLDYSRQDIYSGVGVMRNNYVPNQTSGSNGKFMGSRLRRLQSYQV